MNEKYILDIKREKNVKIVCEFEPRTKDNKIKHSRYYYSASSPRCQNVERA